MQLHVCCGVWSVLFLAVHGREFTDSIRLSFDDTNSLSNLINLNEVEDKDIAEINMVGQVPSAIVLVLDVSGSMDTQNRVYKMNHALRHWINFIVPDDLEIGIVQFNTDADVLCELTTVSDNTREVLVGSLPSAAQGGNCVVCGLNAAIHVLSDAMVTGAIILITDGDNLEHIRGFEDTTPIFTFIFGEINSNSDDLQNVPYFVQDFDAVTRTIAALTKTLLFVSLSPTPVIPLFESEATGLTPLINGTFKVDPLAPYQLTLCLYSGPPDIASITAVTLTEPDGQRVSPDVTGSPALQIALDDRMSGQWFINVSLSEKPSKYAAVFVLARKMDEPNYVDSAASAWDISSKSTGLYPGMTTIVLTVRVIQRHYPVIGARVTVKISSDRVDEVLELFDNGCGMDDKADDGVYSRSFTHPSGKYSLHFTSRGTGHVPANVTGEQPAYVVRPMHNFISVQDATLKVGNKANVIYPPCAIKDLQVESTEGNVVTLRWTATGGYIDRGQAIQYFWKCSNEKEALLKPTSELVKTTLVTYRPGAFGHSESVNVTLPSECERTRQVHVGIGGIGPSGLWSTLSNVVQLAAPVTTPSGLNAWTITLLVLGGTLVACAITVLIAAFVMKVNKSRKKYKVIRNTDNYYGLARLG